MAVVLQTVASLQEQLQHAREERDILLIRMQQEVQEQIHKVRREPGILKPLPICAGVNPLINKV